MQSDSVGAACQGDHTTRRCQGEHEVLHATIQRGLPLHSLEINRRPDKQTERALSAFQVHVDLGLRRGRAVAHHENYRAAVRNAYSYKRTQSFHYCTTLCVSAVIAVVQCLSVTLVDSIHTAEDIVKLLVRPDSPTTLVF